MSFTHIPSAFILIEILTDGHQELPDWPFLMPASEIQLRFAYSSRTSLPYGLGTFSGSQLS
jgi:hypothetical protein